MKTGGEGTGAGAAVKAALLVVVLVVAASPHADAAAAARRLGAADPVLVGAELPGPHANPCTNDPNNPGNTCHGGPGQQDAAAQLVTGGKASSGPNRCTHDPNDPPGKKCLSPPKAP
ncbi:hypothetical protein ACP70R_006804 [Stipagrostis hirtigluma subsp. patula]